jgi:UDP-N-acetylmuramoyl-tripeptide--D-alanyl-D-alanine ligase
MMKQSFFSHIQTDISKVEKGDWFLPMTIKDINQHGLVSQALDKGAVGFTFEVQFKSLLPVLALQVEHNVVPNLRDYLFSLAQEKRPLLTCPIAVIAGSAGKTSVKELVGSILKSWLETGTFMSPENQNTKIALATQILRLPIDCQAAVFEMGARRLNDFAVPLSYLQPSVVALLNIGTAHIGEFGSKENLWQEKLSCLNVPSAETLVIPGDEPEIQTYALKTGKKLVTFGFAAHNSVQILKEEASAITLNIHGEIVTFHCAFGASAKALNVAAAVGVSLSLGVPLEVLRTAVANFKGVPRRFQHFMWDQTAAIDDAFNASPESLFQGLQELKKVSSGKKVLLVLGSILELDQAAEFSHRQAARQIKDLFLTLGKNADDLAVASVGAEARWITQELKDLGFPEEKLQHFTSSTEAKSLKSTRDAYDLVYFKGSKSVNLQAIFGAS